jgi:hypothetical protein
MEPKIELVWVEQVFEVTEGSETYKVVFTSSDKGQRLRRVYGKVTGDEITDDVKRQILIDDVLNSDVFKRRGSNCVD